MFPTVKKILFVGNIVQPIKGKHIAARAPDMPLINCTIALFEVEWNSATYEVTAENGPVNLNKNILDYMWNFMKNECVF